MNANPKSATPASPNIPRPRVEPPLLAGLIRGEMLHGVKRLRASYAHLDQLRSEGVIPTTLSGQTAFDDTVRMLSNMADDMELLACLAETYADSSDSNQERLFLYSMLTGIIGGGRGKTAPRFVVKEPQTEVAPVYGNKEWLRLLLSYLLRELDASVGPTEKIVFTLRQLGNHMVLSSGTEALTAAERNRPRASPFPGAGLTESFCQRIVELHGGTLRLLHEDDGGQGVLSGITLSLPTSVQGQAVTNRCNECPLIDQIECYATDLAVLMDRCEQLERKPHA